MGLLRHVALTPPPPWPLTFPRFFSLSPRDRGNSYAHQLAVCARPQERASAGVQQAENVNPTLPLKGREVVSPAT